MIVSQMTFIEVFDKFCMCKFEAILKDETHPLFSLITFSARSQRIILKRTNRERYRNSFLPYAIRAYSKHNNKRL